MAGRLNIDGDGQGDLAGHGGLNRPVMSRPPTAIYPSIAPDLEAMW
jgi:hypothetical protein